MRIVVQKDQVTGALSVLFQQVNEPKTIGGLDFDVRATTIASASWSDASVGRLPENITEGLSGADIESLKDHVLDLLIAYNKTSGYQSITEPDEDDDNCDVSALPKALALHP